MYTIELANFNSQTGQDWEWGYGWESKLKKDNDTLLAYPTTLPYALTNETRAFFTKMIHY